MPSEHPHHLWSNNWLKREMLPYYIIILHLHPMVLRLIDWEPISWEELVTSCHHVLCCRIMLRLVIVIMTWMLFSRDNEWIQTWVVWFRQSREKEKRRGRWSPEEEDEWTPWRHVVNFFGHISQRWEALFSFYSGSVFVRWFHTSETIDGKEEEQ